MSRIKAFFSPRNWGRVFRAIFGDLSYKPPHWLSASVSGLAGSLRRKPGVWVSVITVAASLAAGGWYGWKWWEAHKPRPTVVVEQRKTKGSLQGPLATTIVKGKPVIQPITLRFDASTAPVEQIGKKTTDTVSLTPEHQGEWKWTDDKTLTFTTETDWPADTEFKVQLSPEKLPKETVLEEKEFTFTTRSVLPEVKSFGFYTDPTNPSIHQVVAELSFNYPVDLQEIEKKLKLSVIGDVPLFNFKGKAPKSNLTVTEGKNGRQFFVRSTRISIPEKEAFVNLELAPGLHSTTGGKSSAAPVFAKTKVPDINSGFSISGVHTDIIRTDEGDPEQYFFVNTSGYADGSALEKNLQVWYRPYPNEEQPGFRVDENLTPELIAKYQFKPVKFTRVETETDGETSATTSHAFKFTIEESGQLLVRVKSGVEALGGFKLPRDFSTFADVPSFPREIEIIGKGGLLALNGERKLGIKSRGVPWVRITLARVPYNQVQHLARFTDGDFDSPYFKLYVDETNIAHFHREVRQLPMRNGYEATYSTFDFTEALTRADAADPDASRGMFFVTLEAVKPKYKSQRRLIGDGARNDWSPLYQDDTIEEATEAENEGTVVDEEPAEEYDEEYSDENDNSIFTKRFILVTDLGIIAKTNADQTRQIFLASVQKGEPITGADVSIIAKNGEFLAQAVTDEQGSVKLPDVSRLRKEKTPAAIIARLGNDVAFLPFHREDRRLDYSRFDIDGIMASEKDALDASLFTERGIYRPGDTIHIGAIVRSRNWQGELDGLPLEIEIKNSRDQFHSSQKIVLPADGYVAMEASTSETDPTGIYVASLFLVHNEDHRVRLGRTTFRLEDFQPDRMKGALTFNKPDQAGWINPDDVEAIFKLQSLFGFPAANRLVSGKLELSAANFSFDAYTDFTFHNRLLTQTQELAGMEVELGEQQTNNDGIATFPLALDRFEGGCFRMDITVEGFEADGGRSVRAGRTVLVAPFDYVVGYKADGDLDYISKDSVRMLKLLAIGPDLKPKPVEGLTRRLVQIRHVSVLTQQENGNYAYVSTPRETVVEESSQELTATGFDVALPSGNVGEFRLELLDASNRVVCLCPFTVVGKGDPGRSLERNAELELQLAKGEWNSGEQLELNYRAPYTGAGLITIERDGVLVSKWFKATQNSGTEFITVPDGLEGTAYVNVSFVRALDSPEIFMSPLSYAVKPFTANPNARRMTVEVDAPQLVKPGQTLNIGYKTEKPSRIIVYAVDAGIHQITDYKLPKPLDFFFRKRALEVQTEQLLDMLLPEFSLLQKLKAYGGDEDAALRMNLNPFKRRKEAPVVFWSGVIEAGPDRKEISYTVPDYFAGQINIMAVAVAPDAIGSAETKAVVRGPMVLTPNVPVFAAPGDEFVASLTVANNLEGPSATSTIQITATGTPQLEVIDGHGTSLEVQPGKEATGRFRVKVKESLGGAELVFKATAGTESMERRATLSVRPATPYLTNVQSGYFRLSKQDINVERLLYAEYAKRETTLSVLPLGLTRGLQAYLSEFPYGCTEQVTSRAMGRLLLSNEADFGYDKAEASKAMDTAFSLLRSRQNSSGSFGYWNAGATSTFDFLSLYVSHFLIEAQEAGYAVPFSLLDGAKNYLKKVAGASPNSLFEARQQASAIYLLTRGGEVTTNQLLNLRDTLEKKHKDIWQADVTATYMASTYVMLKQAVEGATLLTQHQNAIKVKPAEDTTKLFYYEDQDMLRALDFALICRHFPDVAAEFGYDEIKPITQVITENRFSTISAAHTILALKAYANLAQKSDIKLSISSLADAKATPTLLLPQSSGLLNTPFAIDTKVLRFELDQAGKADLGAFYQVVESGYDKAIPEEKIAHGLEIYREFVNTDGITVTNLKVGEGCTVKIHLRNISPADQSNIAVVDLLPGGFELEPGSLRPGLNSVPGADFVEVREDRNVFFCNLEKGKTLTFTYRVKPVAAGQFVIPPAFAESMYDRGIHARAAGASVEVSPTP